MLILVSIVWLFSAPNTASAMGQFLSTVEDVYPQSSSLDAGCQLCHQNSFGGNGWNEYGWAFRAAFRNASGTEAEKIRAALLLVEGADHDFDGLGNFFNQPSLAGKGSRAFDEIRLGVQPGWTAGLNNTIYFKNGSTNDNQAPPSLPSTTDIDVAGPNPDPLATPISRSDVSVSLRTIADGFNAPVYATTAPGINDALFVVEQTGKIIQVSLSDGSKTEFFDVQSDLVSLTPAYDERGLLGLAFHPEYASNGLFYTHQSEPVRAEQDADVLASTITTPDHRSMIVEYRATNPLSNPVITKVGNLITVNQPQFNHNGGSIEFGADGYLYVSFGDGGNANDEGDGHGEFGNASDPSNPLGSILRIIPQGNGSYTVPADNPFVASTDGQLPETYAYGFRNPYRFSFDSVAGDLIAADVGQNDIEEINIVTSGGNYGWNWKEGSFGFYDITFDNISAETYVSDVTPPSAPANLVDPIAQYDHDEGRSITGGYVYRGNDIQDLQGRYIFGDYVSKRLFMLNDNANIVELTVQGEQNLLIAAFAQDQQGELYLLGSSEFGTANSTGVLQKIELPETTMGNNDELCLPIKASSSNGERPNFAIVCL